MSWSGLDAEAPLIVARSVVDAIGKTPLLRLNRASEATGWTPKVALERSLRDIYADARERVTAAR